jgi:hypothetical protein
MFTHAQKGFAGWTIKRNFMPLLLKNLKLKVRPQLEGFTFVSILSLRFFAFFLAFGFFVFLPSPSFGASIRPTLVNGLMQQPSSQYYHYVYGGQFDIARNDDVAYMRLQYLQRPAFKNAGFVDQDLSSALFFGKSVLKKGSFGIGALVGAGYNWGYIKEIDNATASREVYRMPGIGTAIDGRWTSKAVDIRLSYQIMICQNDRELFRYLVAWPFSWFLLSVSTPIEWGGR